MPRSQHPVPRPSKGSVAVVLASVALVLQVLQLGVPSYAGKLITGAAIKNSTITGKDVKNGSLSAEDLATGSLPAGPQGPQGLPGSQGVPGPQGDQGVPGPLIVDHVVVLASTYSPQTITVPVGTTVTWFWDAGIHNVVADDGSFASGAAAAAPRVYLHRFDTPGTFGYHCTSHGGPASGQAGTVVVTAS